MLSIETSFAAHIEEDVLEVQIFGTKGGARWDTKQLFADRDGYMWNATPGYLRARDVWQEKMRHFVEVCAGTRPNVSSGTDGLRIQKILGMIYASAAQATA